MPTPLSALFDTALAVGDWRVNELICLVQDRQYCGSLKEVSQLLGLTAHYLGKIFKQQRGVAFHRFLRNHRAKKAAELLLEGHTLKTIAALTGYENVSNFSNAFRIVYGAAPKKFVASALLKRDSSIFTPLIPPFHK